MSLTRPPLALGRGPRGVHDARRWVSQACREAGRPELVECAELAVSELVTNALLHASPPIDVRVGGTAEHPRFEVRDGSTVLPEPPPVRDAGVSLGPGTGGADELDGLDGLDLDAIDPDALLTFGRGLSLVSRASVAWGADVDVEGKAVWFEPSADLADGPGAAFQATDAPDPAVSRAPGESVDVVVRGVPVAVFLRFQDHYRELRREVRLLALAHEAEYPQAKTLAGVFGSLDRPLRDGMGRRQVEEARAAGLATVDLEVTIGRSEADGLEKLVEVLELADAFCRNERLLSLARSSEQQAFQHWFLTEFVRQADGAEPMPWSAAVDADDESARRTSAS